MPELKIQIIASLAGYVEEIYQTYLESTKRELNAAAMQLKEMAPAPMNSMLHKQPRAEAIENDSGRCWTHQYTKYITSFNLIYFQFYPWFFFSFPLFQTHFSTLPYSRTT